MKAQVHTIELHGPFGVEKTPRWALMRYLTIFILAWPYTGLHKFGGVCLGYPKRPEGSMQPYWYLHEQPHSCGKRRIDYRVRYFGVRRSLSLTNEIGTEHRTRSTHTMYHTFSWSKLGLHGTRSFKLRFLVGQTRSKTEHSNARLGLYNKQKPSLT